MRSYRFWPDENVFAEKRIINSGDHKIPVLILRKKGHNGNATGILWFHGGGYATGFKEMVYIGRAENLVKKYSAVVVSVGYRLSVLHPFPAGFDDCYNTLLYMKDHAFELGIRDDQIMVGGESAGGGLCAAVCMKARDTKDVNIAYQMPLYPMIDNFDTDSSRNNHARVWNTRRNHQAWSLYLRGMDRSSVPPYAAPSRQTDYCGLPPAYSFVGTTEPFYDETLTRFYSIAYELFEIKSKLLKNVIGQDRCVSKLIESIFRIKITDSNGENAPLGVFFFVGPPGVGN